MKTKIDINTRKTLFKEYSGCHWIEVTKAGAIKVNRPVNVEYVAVDKDGNVYVRWRNSDYDALKIAEVNVVTQAAYGEYIAGVFTNEVEARTVAKERFNEEKKEKIEQLEAELAELKKDM